MGNLFFLKDIFMLEIFKMKKNMGLEKKYENMVMFMKAIMLTDFEKVKEN